MKNKDINFNHLNEQDGGQIVFAPQNGKPGYRVKKPDGSLGQWIPVDKSEYGKPGVQADIDRYVKSGGKLYTPAKPKPKPDSSLDSPVAGKGPEGNEVGSKPSTQPPATPSPAPSPTPSGSGGGGGGSASRPAPTPAPAAPKPSPVAAYMTAAAKARKSGDPAEMAKVRDMGMDIWRKSNPKLAAAADERARTRGTSATTNPLMGDMKSKLPSPQTPAPTPTPKVTISTDKQMSTTADALSKNPIKKEVKKEAYDVVLDYLLSEGHADTLSEAHYVMLQMDAEHIQNIIEAQGEWFGGLRDKARASRAAQIQSMQSKPKPGTNVSSPFAKPASRDDSGKLTTYGAGGGAAAERAGQTRAQVMQQGAKNLETRNKSNPGPNFGR